jgi:HK97 gp10 family phage protein
VVEAISRTAQPRVQQRARSQDHELEQAKPGERCAIERAGEDEHGTLQPQVKMTSNADAVAKRVSAWSGNVGPSLARATLEAATVLTAQAKREAPVRTGRLRRSVSYVAGGQLRYVVRPNVPYAAAVHGGTGIYGPKRKPIRPGGLMRFKTRDGKWISTRSIKGQKANPFMTRALQRSEPRIRQIAAAAGASIVVRQG